MRKVAKKIFCILETVGVDIINVLLKDYQIVQLFLMNNSSWMGAEGQNKCEASGLGCGWVASLLFCAGWVELV